MGDGRALGEGVVGDFFACGQHTFVEGKLFLAADLQLPACHVAIYGKIGMPAIGDGDDAVAEIAHLAADAELAVGVECVADLDVVGKGVAAVFAAIGVGKGDAGAVGVAERARQRLSRGWRCRRV